MNVITQITEIQQLMEKKRRDGFRIGFVPTMGYLHKGHLKLLQKARNENDIVVLSIFVNPLQFGEGEDYETYPRDFRRDEELAQAAGVDVLFYPEANAMYPIGQSVMMKVMKRADVLCGASRPGHFDGVVTVLTKLFHIVLPHRAYFGLKDAQQVAVVKGLCNDYNFPVDIVEVEIEREQDGLALSSRNVRLTARERDEAPALYASLKKAKALIAAGEKNPTVVKETILSEVTTNTSAKIDYVEILSYPELEQLEKLTGQAIIALAVNFSTVRLIDNVIIHID